MCIFLGLDARHKELGLILLESVWWNKVPYSDVANACLAWVLHANNRVALSVIAPDSLRVVLSLERSHGKHVLHILLTYHIWNLLGWSVFISKDTGVCIEGLVVYTWCNVDPVFRVCISLWISEVFRPCSCVMIFLSSPHLVSMSLLDSLASLLPLEYFNFSNKSWRVLCDDVKKWIRWRATDLEWCFEELLSILWIVNEIIDCCFSFLSLLFLIDCHDNAESNHGANNYHENSSWAIIYLVMIVVMTLVVSNVRPVWVMVMDFLLPSSIPAIVVVTIVSIWVHWAWICVSAICAFINNCVGVLILVVATWDLIDGVWVWIVIALVVLWLIVVVYIIVAGSTVAVIVIATGIIVPCDVVCFACFHGQSHEGNWHECWS